MKYVSELQQRAEDTLIGNTEIHENRYYQIEGTLYQLYFTVVNNVTKCRSDKIYTSIELLSEKMRNVD